MKILLHPAGAQERLWQRSAYGAQLPPARYDCAREKHVTAPAAACRWPVHCALCGDGLYRWYYGMRAPMCVLCIDKSGPVLAPAAWELDPHRSSLAGRRVWESWAAVTVGAIEPLPDAEG